MRFFKTRSTSSNSTEKNDPKQITENVRDLFISLERSFFSFYKS